MLPVSLPMEKWEMKEQHTGAQAEEKRKDE